MNSILIQLLFCASTVIAMPALDSEGIYEMGSEDLVTQFAVLSGSTSDNLPGEFTICGSVSTSRAGARTGTLSPFNLLHEDGKPWISVFSYVEAANFTHHHILLVVSSIFSCPEQLNR